MEVANPARFVLLALLSALLLSSGAFAAIPESSLRSEYDFRVNLLKKTMNLNGGWGEPLYVDGPNNTTQSATMPTHQSFNETLVAVLALRAAGIKPVDHWENYADKKEVSLAASDVPNTLNWLRAQEAQRGAELTSGQLALTALSYDRLGDRDNAERILERLTTTYRDTDGWGDLISISQTVWALHESGFRLNQTVNETVSSALSHLVFAKPHERTLEELAWGFMALHAYNLQQADDYRAIIATRWDPVAGYASLTRTGLMGWALSQDPQQRSAALEAVEYLYTHGQEGTGRAARSYYVLAESNIHPHFSVEPVPTATGGIPAIAGESDSRNPFISKDEYDRLLRENQELQGQVDDLEDRALPFPLPPWLMGAILLSAITVLVIVKLAWGLKREDLDGARKNLFEYIEAHPGEHLNKIRRELSMAPGTVMYHLNNLEGEGWITSHKDSRYKRYYVNGNKLTQILPGGDYKAKYAILANNTSAQIAKFLRENPGATQKAVSARMGLHPSTVNWHAKRMREAGLLSQERAGKEVRYQLADEKFLERYLQQKGAS